MTDTRGWMVVDFGVRTWMGVTPRPHLLLERMCHAIHTNATLAGVCFPSCLSSFFEEPLSRRAVTVAWGVVSLKLNAYIASLQSTGKRSALGTVREAELYGGVLSSSLSREHLALTAEFLRGDEYVIWDLAGLLTFLITYTTGRISSMSLLPSSPHPSSLAMNSTNMYSPP